MDKKRITIFLDYDNPEQREVCDYLASFDRKKTEIICDAILEYKNGTGLLINTLAKAVLNSSYFKNEYNLDYSSKNIMKSDLKDINKDDIKIKNTENGKKEIKQENRAKRRTKVDEKILNENEIKKETDFEDNLDYDESLLAMGLSSIGV